VGAVSRVKEGQVTAVCRGWGGGVGGGAGGRGGELRVVRGVGGVVSDISVQSRWIVS